MRFKGLDLNLLVALDVLFQELNVTHAAGRLNTTQSTVSGMLSRLRSHFHDELLVPYGRALRMTPLADQLQGPLHEAILKLESIVGADGGFDPVTSIRHFRVEFPDHLVPVLLPTVIRRLARHAPNVTIEFSLPRGDPAPLLYRGELDLVVTPHSYKAAEYHSISLVSDELVVVGWDQNPDLQGEISDGLLGHLPMITVRFDPNRISGTLTGDQVHMIEGRGNVFITAPSFSAIPLMLVGTRYFSFLHRKLAEHYARQIPLIIRDVPFTSPQLSDVAMYHPNRANDQGLMWLVGQLVAASSELSTCR